MPAPLGFEAPRAGLEIKTIAPKPKPTFGLKAESPEAKMVKVLDNSQSNPNQKLEALAYPKFSPSDSAMKDFLRPTTVTGVATRIGHLQQQLEGRDLSDDAREKIAGQLKELESQLKILAGEVKGLPQEKAEALKNKTYSHLETAESSYLAENRANMGGGRSEVCR